MKSKLMLGLIIMFIVELCTMALVQTVGQANINYDDLYHLEMFG